MIVKLKHWKQSLPRQGGHNANKTLKTVKGMVLSLRRAPLRERLSPPLIWQVLRRVGHSRPGPRLVKDMLVVSLYSQGNRAFDTSSVSEQQQHGNQGLKRLRQHTDEEKWEMSRVGHIICYGRLKDKQWKVRVKRVGLVILFAISMLYTCIKYNETLVITSSTLFT